MGDDDYEPTVSGDRVEGLLVQVLEVPETKQAEALQQLCAEHPEVAATLRSRFGLFRRLLGSDSERVDLAARPASFGEFELERELGRGGMGVVYLARQRRGATERLVALKLVQDRGMFTPQARERFRREADAAFRLDHPVICPVLDVGEVDGTPYLAMRYVPGETLAQCIAAARDGEQSLCLPSPAQTDATGNATRQISGTATDRVGVIVAFIEQVARALHAAHEAGLVHRDVKPGNLIVTPDGAPVLLDFGLVRDTADETSKLTLTGQAIGTPAYMSPEQISPKGRSLDRTTDVYSLGATLFEALTLRPLFEAGTREQLFRQILTESPPDPRRLAPGISRDVAVVLNTALDKDPGRRYATALELAEDLRRARSRQPIFARPPGVVRRLRLWGQRNPLASAILVLLAVAQLVIAVLVVQARRSAEDARVAEARAVAHFQSARDAVAELTRTADEHLADVPWLEPVRRDLFDKALAFHRGFLEAEGDDPALQFTAALAQRESGALLRSLGDLEAAMARLDAAVAALEPLVGRVEHAERHLVWTHFAASQVAERMGDHRRARAELAAGLELERRRLARHPDGLDVRMSLGRGLRAMAGLNLNLDEREAARVAVGEALGLLRGLAVGTDGRRIELARALGLSGRLFRDARQFDAADADLVTAAELLRAHLEVAPHDRGARALLGTNRIAHGTMCRAARRYADGGAAYRDACEVFEHLAAAFPGIPDYQYNLATALNGLATLARSRGIEAEGIAELERAIPILEQLVRDYPADPSYLSFLATIRCNLGNRIWRRSPADAMPQFELALDLMVPLLAEQSDHVRYVARAASASNMLAICLAATGHHAEAGPMMTQARGYAEKLVELRPESASYRRGLGRQLYNEGSWFAETGDFDAAAERLRQSCDQRRWLVGQRRRDPRAPYDLALSWSRLGWVEDCRGDGAAVWREAHDAMAGWSDAIRQELGSTPKGLYQWGCLEHGYAASVARAGDTGTARSELARAIERLESVDGGLWQDLELILALTLDAALARRAGDAESAPASALRAADLAARLDLHEIDSQLVTERLRRGLAELEQLLPTDAAAPRAAVRELRGQLGGG